MLCMRDGPPDQCRVEEDIDDRNGCSSAVQDVGELEHAFRQGRRVRATAVSDKDGMLLATRFDEMLGEILSRFRQQASCLPWQVHIPRLIHTCPR